VAVADGLALPYRPSSCDAALCIAVLHHLASPARRLALLAQLLRILQPGGRALVTVWATRQSNMRKVRSWQPVSLSGGGDSSVGPGQALPEAAADEHEGSVAAEVVESLQQPADGTKAGAAQAVASGDYFVPWHVPFHRADAAAAARHVSAAEQQQGLQQHSTQQLVQSASCAAQAAGGAAAAEPRVDGRKGAVVFQRYYHLFEEGELDALVAQLPGATLVESFYDKDNWCCVFERCLQP
jgi:alkylated DNA repair protein alkB family protein 8